MGFWWIVGSGGMVGMVRCGGGDWVVWFFLIGLVCICWVFFFSFLNLDFWFRWDFGGQWVMGVWLAWWWCGRDWVVWLLRERHRGKDRNERKRSDR